LTCVFLLDRGLEGEGEQEEIAGRRSTYQREEEKRCMVSHVVSAERPDKIVAPNGSLTFVLFSCRRSQKKKVYLTPLNYGWLSTLPLTYQNQVFYLSTY
jgi:hypothetical protein